MQEDTSVDRVLVSDDYVYWGGNGPPLPEFGGCNLCKEGRGYRVNFPEEVAEEFVEWIRRLQGASETGVCGNPLDLKMSEKIRRKSRKAVSFGWIELRGHRVFCWTDEGCPWARATHPNLGFCWRQGRLSFRTPSRAALSADVRLT